MIRSVFGLFLILLLPFDLSAQVFIPNPDWRFENFNGQNHFISREISTLAMDEHGYVWACSRGVQRFDGYRTIDFSSVENSTGGLRDNTTNCISDNNGRIWVSSSGLCYYDDTTGKFLYVRPDTGPDITDVYAFCVQKKYLWFVCDRGLARIDTHSLKISFTALSGITDPMCIYLIDENTLLVSSREKVYIYNIKKNTYSVRTFLYDHSLVKIVAVAQNGKDLFLGTNYGLFALKNLKDISLVDKGTKGVIIDDLLFLPGDKQKKYLLLGTEDRGILIYNTILKKVEFTYVHDDKNPFSLPNNRIARFLIDKNNRLWISTGFGICMLDVANQQLKMRFLNESNGEGPSINKMFKDKYDSSKVWMSYYNKGFVCMNWTTKQEEKVFNTVPEMHQLIDFEQLSKGKWLLLAQKKIMELDIQTGTILTRELPVPDSAKLTYTLRRIIIANANTCFITTNKGLFRYTPATHKVSAVSVISKSGDPLQYNLINGLYDNGVLWIASRNGLFSYDIARQITTVYRGKGEKLDYFFFDIANAPNNRVVCASAYGIAIFDKKTKNFTVVNSIAGLYKPYCVSVTSINHKIWIATETGILTYDPDTRKSVRAEREDPLMYFFPTSQFINIGTDIAFGFRNGYAYFTPEPENVLVPSDPIIEKVSTNNQPVLQRFDTRDSAGKLALSHSENSVDITFTAFLFADPAHINFRYRLKGADTAWQFAGDQRSANYAQLEPGNYTFYVQSGDKNGTWNGHLASFSFIIKPPYWATWWFRTLAILVIALVLYRLYRYRIRHILAIERIRERIASDFHDDIGSALSSISIFSAVADKQLQQQAPPEKTREVISHISFHSRTMLEAMDDIIWAVNPQNDHFNDLAVRMREFAIPLLEAKNIQFDIDVQEDIMNTRIKMEARKNIFLIFKECINNIIKHADCSAMKVTVNKLNNQLELIISDNGKGFDMNAPHNRNGLKNMQKRAGEVNGIIQVTSQSGDGTVIRLVINII